MRPANTEDIVEGVPALTGPAAGRRAAERQDSRSRQEGRRGLAPGLGVVWRQGWGWLGAGAGAGTRASACGWSRERRGQAVPLGDRSADPPRGGRGQDLVDREWLCLPLSAPLAWPLRPLSARFPRLASL